MHAYTAFAAQRRLASGELASIVRALKTEMATDPDLSYQVFDNATGHCIDLDLRGTVDDALARLAPIMTVATTPAGKTGPGRPKLGVVAREITLLPRHWDWLASQPGGASVALRKLVETASRASRARDKARISLEVCHSFMLTMGGNLPGFEEATRALFAGQFDAARSHMATWPMDLREHAETLLETAQNDAYEARED
ncbi:DUF2239 family protein [Uliginosibacterium sp. 31-16]|uniref:DUF2239 family protein n=1 Tax=Uliginosibacterium sp. 31-16 TaxID=3068315 RepID=UPI00273FF863|nr:DUF2239 family protein [Uliginosibacterium sp. 31-16]MDP5240207.1 DUF2239 family protein [Uliginosibacterium sp. 31-16]